MLKKTIKTTHLLPRSSFVCGSRELSLIHRLERLLAGCGCGPCAVVGASFGTEQRYCVNLYWPWPVNEFLVEHLSIFMGASGVDVWQRGRELELVIR